MDIEKVKIYTAYYENDLGNEYGAFLSDDKILSKKIDCQVVTADGFLAFKAEYLSMQDRLTAAESELERLPAKWSEDSSLKTWFPLTSEMYDRTLIENESLRNECNQLRQQLDAAKYKLGFNDFINALKEAGWKDTADAQWDGASKLHDKWFSTPQQKTPADSVKPKFNFTAGWCEKMARMEAECDADITAGVPQSVEISGGGDEPDPLGYILSTAMRDVKVDGKSVCQITRRKISVEDVPIYTHAQPSPNKAEVK